MFLDNHSILLEDCVFLLGKRNDIRADPSGHQIVSPLPALDTLVFILRAKPFGKHALHGNAGLQGCRCRSRQGNRVNT